MRGYLGHQSFLLTMLEEKWSKYADGLKRCSFNRPTEEKVEIDGVIYNDSLVELITATLIGSRKMIEF